MKAVYKVEYITRYADLSGVFIANTEDMAKLKSLDPKLHLGEVCGKHSDVYTKYSDWQIEEILDENVVCVVEQYKLYNGINLWTEYLNYLEEQEWNNSTSDDESYNNQNDK